MSIEIEQTHESRHVENKVDQSIRTGHIKVYVDCITLGFV